MNTSLNHRNREPLLGVRRLGAALAKAPTSRRTPKSSHAVVLGGSLAGLVAARVLSDHFEQVTLIERDAYSETTETRRGIPQANHVHGLLARGRQILEELFPGMQNEMIAAGAPVVDIANEIAWFTPAGWGVRFPSELMILAFTRPLLDLHVRRRLAEDPRVKILDNTYANKTEACMGCRDVFKSDWQR